MTTPNYNLNLPVIGGSTDTWGNLLNDNFSLIDTALQVNATAAAAAQTTASGALVRNQNLNDVASKSASRANLGADDAANLVKGLLHIDRIGAGRITNNELASGINAAKLTTGTLPIDRIANGAVTNAKLASGIDGAKLAAESILRTRLAAGIDFPAGTRMLFQQTNAPTGWTKDTSHNNKALRVVSGSVGSGGVNSFTNAFNANRTSSSNGAHTHTITVNNHTLTVSQLPAHHHLSGFASRFSGPASWGANGSQGRASDGGEKSVLDGTSTQGSRTSARSDSTGGGQGHNHGASSGSAGAHTHTLNLNVQYVDIIIATRN